MWLNSIISALPGALISGAVISSIFNWQLNQRRLQLQTTFELHGHPPRGYDQGQTTGCSNTSRVVSF